MHVRSTLDAFCRNGKIQTRSGVRGNLLTPDPMPPSKPTTKKPVHGSTLPQTLGQTLGQTLSGWRVHTLGQTLGHTPWQQEAHAMATSHWRVPWRLLQSTCHGTCHASAGTCHASASTRHAHKPLACAMAFAAEHTPQVLPWIAAHATKQHTPCSH